jgi:pimeloyl-ACP methyl ester carboxylesterase
MDVTKPQFLDVGSGAGHRRIAVIEEKGRDPTLLWMPGLKSDMVSTKASEVSRWAREHELGATRFDYSGHGQSGGRFEDGTIGRWLEESREVFRNKTEGQVILVGSSMGGYLALLLLDQLLREAPVEAARIKALVLIAPAWDMTEQLMWKQFPDSVRQTLTRDGLWLRPSAYGEPYPITRQLIEEGRRHLLEGRTIDPGRPVRILHGLLDPDVPWEHTLALEGMLAGDWVRVTMVPDGDHRLSRPEDIMLLVDTLENLVQ